MVAAQTCTRKGPCIWPAMSALGQKQTFALQKVMSALPPKADMCSALGRCPLCANSGHSKPLAIYWWLTPLG